MKIWHRRDLAILTDAGFGRHMVIACDSCGGIGQKHSDTLNIPPYYVGRLTSRVALMEVLCSGAHPIALGNGISSEMHPTGEEIIRGIYDELNSAGLDNIAVNGSTEENFQTSMTAAGITVVGIAEDLRFNAAAAGDRLSLFGMPRLGAEVNLDSGEFYDEIRELLATPGVRELVPVGSRGVAREADDLAALNGLRFIAYDCGIDLIKSAGPATCMLALCDREASERMNGVIVGELV